MGRDGRAFFSSGARRDPIRRRSSDKVAEFVGELNVQRVKKAPRVRSLRHERWS